MPKIEQPFRMIKFNYNMANIIADYNIYQIKDRGITRLDRADLIKRLKQVIESLEDQPEGIT